MRCSGVLLAVAACFAVAAAGTIHVVNDVHDQVAHHDLSARQRAVLHILQHVQQPAFHDEIVEAAQRWDISAHADHYSNNGVVRRWMDLWHQGTLPRGEIFHIHNDVHLDEVIALFDLFYFANDFDTFWRTAAWARQNVNEGQFVYAFCVAVLHRPDCQGLELPPLYEIYPYFYLSATDMQSFNHAQMRGHQQFIASANFSGLYDVTNPEQLLSYFTEDIGLNAYHAYAHMHNPFWMRPERYGLSPRPHRGENFFYFYQQILAHYNLNRMAAYLPEHEDFDWEDRVVRPGYHAGLMYHSGHMFPARPDDAEISSIRSYSVDELRALEHRIMEAIDSGYVMTREGSRISISHHLQGINILGNLIEGNRDSVNNRYYGSYYSMLRNLFALIMDPQDRHGVAPGPMAHFETALRDPAFYIFMRHINDMFVRYNNNLPAYRNNDLFFNGVAIKNVQIDDLVTYFDYFDLDVSNAINVAHHEDASHMNYIARVPRLNHQPFSVRINVASDRRTNAVVRIFMGPRAEMLHSNFFGDSNVQYFGHDTYDLDRLRHHFVELDRFPVRINNGQNVIVRQSHEFSSTVGDHTSFRELLRQVESGNWAVSEVDSSCGFPDRLALPMGHVSGMPYTFFVIVTPYGQEHDNSDDVSGHDWNDVIDNLNVNAHSMPVQADYSNVEHQAVHIHPVPHVCNGVMSVFDGHSQGFPFDREIHSFNRFYTPNMYFMDVNVFHRNTSDVHRHHHHQQSGHGYSHQQYHGYQYQQHQEHQQYQQPQEHQQYQQRQQYQQYQQYQH